MIKKLFKNAKLHAIVKKYISSIIDKLIEENLNFSIVCDTSKMVCYPPLSKELSKQIGIFSVFVLSGYSFESIKMSEGFLEFEAGLTSKKDNQDIATLLKIPYEAIVQIFLQDENNTKDILLFSSPISPKMYGYDVENIEDGINKSRDAILSKNMKFIRK